MWYCLTVDGVRMYVQKFLEAPVSPTEFDQVLYLTTSSWSIDPCIVEVVDPFTATIHNASTEHLE